MRCPQCNKFVSYDTDVDPEENSQEINGTRFVASYRRVLQCGECGEELKEAEIMIEYDFSGDIEGQDEEEAEGKKAIGAETHTHNFEIENCDVSPTTGAVTKDRHGRPIRNSRYMATLYGVACNVDVECECGATASFEVEGDERASSFEELA